MQEYNWELDDITRQIQQEVYRNPESCLALDIIAWYNSLYSELSVPTTDSYRDDGCGAYVQSAGDVLGVMLDYTLEQLFDVVVSYYVAQLTGLPQNEVSEALNNFRQAVQDGL